MSGKKSANSVTRISEARHGEDEYLLLPEDNDLFVRTGRQIIAACQLGISVELWLNELSAAMKKAHDWAKERPAQVRSCYCSPRGGSVVFFVAPQSEQFDFDLADSMADLNLDLLKTFNLGLIEVRQIPWAEFDRFVDPESGKRLYGEHFQPPTSVGA